MRRKQEKLPGKPILDYGKRLGLSATVTARIMQQGGVCIEPKLFPSIDALATRILDRIRPEIVAELLLLQETALLSGLPKVPDAATCSWCRLKAKFILDEMALCPNCARIASNMKAAVRKLPYTSYRL